MAKWDHLSSSSASSEASSSDTSTSSDPFSAAVRDPSQILLPLLTPDPSAPFAQGPPISNLPAGSLTPRRIAFRTTTNYSSSSSLKPNGGALAPDAATESEHIDWLCTTHTFPAAYPRTHAYSTCPPCPANESPKSPQPLPASALASSEAEKAHDKARRELDAKYWREELLVVDDLNGYLPPSSRAEALRIAQRRRNEKHPQLWGVVERILPVRHHTLLHKRSDIPRREPVTLFMFHATGFHKEIYEPALQQLAQQLSHHGLDASGALEIDEIWSMDMISSGESGVLNGSTLGPTVHWLDAARDIIQLLTNYLPSLPAMRAGHNSGTRSSGGGGVKDTSASSSGTTAQLWPPPVLTRCGVSSNTQETLRVGHRAPSPRARRIIAVGHSFAGAALSVVANAYPGIFEKIVLFDPILVPTEAVTPAINATVAANDAAATAKGKKVEDEIDLPWADMKGTPLSSTASTRKDVWTSAAAARAYFSSRRVFQSWHPDVLESHLRFGLTPLRNVEGAQQQMVTLAMPRYQEAASFAASWLSAYAYAALRSGAFKRHYGADASKGRTYLIVMRDGGTSSHLLDDFSEDFEPRFQQDSKGGANESGKLLRGSVQEMPGGHLVAQEQPAAFAKKLLECILDDGSPASVMALTAPRL